MKYILERLLNIYKSILEIFSSWQRFLIFLVLMIATLALFIVIPVLSVPGNDLWFQLKIFTDWDWVYMITLAALNSILILLQWRIYQEKKDYKKSAVVIGASGGGALSAVFAAVMSTASCGACITGFLGFLGTGGVIFVMEYRNWFIVLAVFIVLSSIYISSQTLQKGCESCQIEPRGNV